MKYIKLIFILATILFFIDCKNETAKSASSSKMQNTNEDYLKKGKTIAASTFITLSTKLQNAMQKGGVKNAVKYCNLSADGLVDSLENIHNAKIRRTSLKTRNSNNQPSDKELEQLKIYQDQLSNGTALDPVVVEMPNNEIAFYMPILAMPLCQKCHGTIGETLLREDYEYIQQLYPNDKAVGYSAGDWRGMWSITFPK